MQPVEPKVSYVDPVGGPLTFNIFARRKLQPV